MTSFVRFAVILVVGTLACLEARAQAADLPREEIEQIVREFLMREPEVIYDAIQELQRRREVAEAQRQRDTIVSRKAAIFSDPADPVAGDPNGDVTLVEFFDYRCGYCRSMVSGLRALIEKDKNLRFVFKEFPVLGPESMVAARAALAAAEQGPDRYYAFHFELMGSKDLSMDTIRSLAQRAGLDLTRLAADMDSEKVKRTIEANQALAQALGINGTPSFVIGERLIPGAVDIGQLTALVEERRRAAAGG